MIIISENERERNDLLSNALIIMKGRSFLKDKPVEGKFMPVGDL